jgi:hypothetical protein
MFITCVNLSLFLKFRNQAQPVSGNTLAGAPKGTKKAPPPIDWTVLFAEAKELCECTTVPPLSRLASSRSTSPSSSAHSNAPSGRPRISFRVLESKAQELESKAQELENQATSLEVEDYFD